MKTIHRLSYRLAMTCCSVAALGLLGCREEAGRVSLDSAAQSLVAFVGDVARQVLAAYFF